MQARLISPGDLAHAIAGHPLTLRQSASAVISAASEAAAQDPCCHRAGHRP